MISVEQALEKVLGYANVLGAEESPILNCLGQVLAEDIYADINIPPLDNTAMDGYAVQSRDTIGASQQSPRFLRVIDTTFAGSISGCEVETGTAVRGSGESVCQPEVDRQLRAAPQQGRQDAP